MTMQSDWKSTSFRLLGILPIIIFGARLIQYIQVGTPDWIVYSCHGSNLLLGIGMICRQPLLVRVAAIWLIVGVPLWLIDAVVTWVLWWSSIYSHLGGFLLALYAISKVRATGRSWLPALVWFVCLQLIARYTTDPALNINVAHEPYELVQDWFANYWLFWPFCLSVVAALVWIVELALATLYPRRRVSPEMFVQKPFVI